MEIILKRELISNKGILGRLFKDGIPIALTLERPYLNNQPNVSSIPPGTYLVESDTTGGFKWWKLSNVSDRGNIEIHQGNEIEDSKGCILIGKLGTAVIRPDLSLFIGNSIMTLTRLKEEKILPEEFLLKIMEE